MPRFAYEGYDDADLPVTGTLEAADEEVALHLLREQRVRVERVRIRWWSRELGPSRVSRGSVGVFTRLMASLLKSGLKPREALEVLREELPGAPLRRIIFDLSVKVQRGMRLSDATRDHPRVFDGVYSAALAAGEDAGGLRRVMERLAESIQRVERTRKRVVGALTYPAVVLFIVGMVGAGLLYFVVPQFAAVLTENGAELPALTRLLLGASEVTRTVGPVLVVTGVGAGAGGFRLIRRSQAVRERVHRALLRIPVLRTLLVYGSIASFARIFALLHASRTNVVDAVHLAAQTVPNLAIRRSLMEIGEAHAGGRRLSDEMRRVGIIPPIMIAMTSVGERTGALAEQMEVAAGFYEEELDYQVDRLTALLGPLAIVLAFGPVILLVLGIYVPMVQAVRSLG